jgi:mRNA-degrading endonuclease RelE of RelBE toxin-antitoxin system
VSFKKIIVLFLCLLFAQITWAANFNCANLNRIDHPSLKSNAQFWEEYAELSSSGKMNDDLLSKLIEKHIKEPGTPGASKVSKAASDTPSLRVDYTHRAKKEISKLDTKILRESYEEFMDIMSDYSGLQKLRENPGRWNLERVKAFKNEPVYTVRLNGSYRVLFKIEKDELQIMQVNVDAIHKI